MLKLLHSCDYAQDVQAKHRRDFHNYLHNAAVLDGAYNAGYPDPLRLQYVALFAAASTPSNAADKRHAAPQRAAAVFQLPQVPPSCSALQGVPYPMPM